MRIEEKLHSALLRSGKTLALAESCTGGAVAAAITRIPGASKFFLGSFVVYSNEWKKNFLGVSAREAVSAEAVKEMVLGLFARTDCEIAAAVSGIAGPTGATAQIPLGTIFIAVGERGKSVSVQLLQAPRGREAAIDFAVKKTLEALYELSTH